MVRDLSREGRRHRKHKSFTAIRIVKGKYQCDITFLNGIHCQLKGYTYPHRWQCLFLYYYFLCLYYNYIKFSFHHFRLLKVSLVFF